MYVPASFVETDLTRLHDCLERYSFATLVSRDGEEPLASHLPLLIDRAIQPQGRLQGHMARANSQWSTADGQRVLAIFHGPHAYISPTWYEAVNVVPTWNYVAVHAYGTLRVVDDAARLKEIIRRTVEKYESSRPVPWTIAQPEGEFTERLLAAIVGFEIDIDRLEGKWKLNQNHPAERRQKVVRALTEAGAPDGLAIAELMARLP